MSGVGAPIDDRGICWSLRSACADSRYSLLPALPSLSSSSAFSVPTIALLPAPCSSSAFGPKSYLVGSSRSGTPVATGSNLTPSGQGPWREGEGAGCFLFFQFRSFFWFSASELVWPCSEAAGLLDDSLPGLGKRARSRHGIVGYTCLRVRLVSWCLFARMVTSNTGVRGAGGGNPTQSNPGRGAPP
jgi:hypothetical protein